MTGPKFQRYQMTKGAAYGLTILFITVILMFGISIAYAARAAESAKDDANRAVRESQQVWCEVLNYIAGRQATTPTPTEFANQINNLRKAYGCEEPS